MPVATITTPSVGIPTAAKKTVAKHGAKAPTFTRDEAVKIACIFFACKRTGRILLTQRSEEKDHPGEWCASAGGHVDPGETPVEAAIREAMEELDFDELEERYAIEIAHSNREGKDFTTFLYFIKQELAPELDKREAQAWAWFPLDDLPSPLHPAMKGSFKKIAPHLYKRDRGSFGGDAAGSFKEEQHPRDEGGKFTAGASSGRKTKEKPKSAHSLEAEHSVHKELIKHIGPKGPSVKDAAENKTVTFSLHSTDMPKELNGVAFKDFTPPTDWNKVEGQNSDLKETPLQGKPGYEYEHEGKKYRAPGKKPGSGVFIQEPDGRVWIVKPTGKFGGYEQTFPKGKVDEGLNPQANAIKECWEESGLHVKITGIVGDFEGDTSITRIYKAERIGGSPADHGWESEGVVLAKPEDMAKLLNRSRDRKIAKAAGLTMPEEKKWTPPPKPEGKGGSFTAPPAPVGALKMSDLKKTGGKLGSNEGGTYEDDKGNKYYIKKGKSPKHVANELLAGALFKLAGSKTLDYVPVESGEHVATKWQKFDKNNIKEPTPEQLKNAQNDFAVHAWTANWDAAGLEYDNQSFEGNTPVSNDLGGALLYRAQGAPKPSFNDHVGEWNTLRDPKINPQNAKIFGGMTDVQLKESAKKVTSISDGDIIKAVQKSGMPVGIANVLIQRKKDIAKRVGISAVDSKPDQKGGSFC